MSAFRYIGKAAVEVETLGHRFVYGVPTDVSDKAAEKLRNNPYFEEVLNDPGEDTDLEDGHADATQTPRRRGRPPKSGV